MILAEDVGEDVGLVQEEVVDNVGQRLAELRANLNPAAICKKSRAQSTFDKYQNNNKDGCSR